VSSLPFQSEGLVGDMAFTIKHSKSKFHIGQTLKEFPMGYIWRAPCIHEYPYWKRKILCSLLKNGKEITSTSR